MRCQRCPNCSFNQEEPTEECPRCGIVFAKFHARHAVEVGGPPIPPPEQDPVSRTGWIRPVLRMARWFMLIVSAMTLYLILSPAPAPVIAVSPEAHQSAKRKIAQMERYVRAGRARKVDLDQAELNAWLHSNLQLPSAGESEEGQVSQAGLPGSSDPGGDLSSGEIAQLQSTVTDVRVALIGEQVRTYLKFQLYGKEMSFELQGRLSARDGYLHLEPTAGKLGSFPIPAISLSTAASRLFESPENRENFRLPDYISDVAVQGGKLLVQCASRAQR